MMNRSFRGPEALMPSIRPQMKSIPSSVRDRDEDLSLFLEMRKRENEKKNELLFLQESDEFDQTSVSQTGSSPLFDIPSSVPVRKPRADDILNSDSEKNDYDWLLTPPGTPLFPSLEMESRKLYMKDSETSRPQPTVLRSRFANSQTETIVKSNLVPKKPTTGGLISSVSGIRRPSSSGGPGSRPVTPTGRPTLPSSKSSRPSTPTSRSRATLPSAKSSSLTSSPKPTVSSKSTRSTSSTASTKSTIPSRSSTPSRTTARTSVPSNGPSRSSTPSRSTARSYTPTRCTARSSTPTSQPNVLESRPSVLESRPTSRPSTPSRRPSTPSNASGATATLNKSSSSISSKSGLAPSKNLVPSRGASPTVRPRPWIPSEMPGFSLEAPPNLRTTLPDRPLSATRGRAIGPSARSSSVEPVRNNGRPKRQSCSPSRARAPNGGSFHSSGSSVPAVSRGRSNSKVSDNVKVNPAVVGTKMVERVINMRKLGPAGPNDKHSPSLSGKSASSPDSTGGFGRTLSKKSLDMAIRHMDIRRTIPGNLRPLMTKIPTSSMYSVRSGLTGSRAASLCDSPLATSSTASSEFSINNNHAFGIDSHGSDLEYDLISERGQVSLTTIRGR